MEEKDELERPLGLCRRLFRFLVKNLPLYRHKQVSQGRKDVTLGHHREEAVPARRDNAFKANDDDDDDDDDSKADGGSQVDVVIYREGDLGLRPPLVYSKSMEAQENKKDKARLAEASVSGFLRSAKGQDETMKKHVDAQQPRSQDAAPEIGAPSKKASKKFVKVAGEEEGKDTLKKKQPMNKKGAPAAAPVEGEELKKRPSTGQEQGKATPQPEVPQPTKRDPFDEFIKKKKESFASHNKKP